MCVPLHTRRPARRELSVLPLQSLLPRSMPCCALRLTPGDVCTAHTRRPARRELSVLSLQSLLPRSIPCCAPLLTVGDVSAASHTPTRAARAVYAATAVSPPSLHALLRAAADGRRCVGRFTHADPRGASCLCCHCSLSALAPCPAARCV